MEFINQHLDLPKKSSLSGLSEVYQETSVQDILNQQLIGQDGERKLAFSKKDALENERASLEQEKNNLEEERKVLQAKCESFEALLQEQKTQIEEWKKEAVHYFSEVVFKIAKAIVAEELHLKPERLQDLILNLVQKTYGESERRLVLHPLNLEWMKKNIPEFVTALESKHQIAVSSQESVQENSFILETSLHQYQENPFLNIDWLKKELYPTS